jgi:hypothetical protein
MMGSSAGLADLRIPIIHNYSESLDENVSGDSFVGSVFSHCTSEAAAEISNQTDRSW